MVKLHDAKLTEIEQAAHDALVDAAKAVLKTAKTLVPVDYGDLKRSGKVEAQWQDVAVVFRAPHAWLQHERLDFEHPNGGQAKYLEAAVDQVGVEAAIVGAVRARLR